MPHVGTAVKSVDRGGHGKWVAWCRPGPRSRASTPGSCAKASEKDKGGFSGEVCGV